MKLPLTLTFILITLFLTPPTKADWSLDVLATLEAQQLRTEKAFATPRFPIEQEKLNRLRAYATLPSILSRLTESERRYHLARVQLLDDAFVRWCDLEIDYLNRLTADEEQARQSSPSAYDMDNWRVLQEIEDRMYLRGYP